METRPSQGDPLADAIITASTTKIGLWLRQAPKEAFQIRLYAYELGATPTLWLSTAADCLEHFPEPDKLAEFIREQCQNHASSYQSECRYEIVWKDTQGEAIGSFGFRIIPKAAAGQRFTGSMENVVVQLQRHIEQIMKIQTSSAETTIKGMQTVIETQQRSINELVGSLRTEREEKEEMETLAKAIESNVADSEARDKLFEFLEKVAPVLAGAGNGKG